MRSDGLISFLKWNESLDKNNSLFGLLPSANSTDIIANSVIMATSTITGNFGNSDISFNLTTAAQLD